MKIILDPQKPDEERTVVEVEVLRIELGPNRWDWVELRPLPSPQLWIRAGIHLEIMPVTCEEIVLKLR